MFVKPVVTLLLSALLGSTGSSVPSSETDASRSCAELAAQRSQTDAAATRLAEWMERHCPGALEDTEPFCRLQSGLLLERLAELGELKAALAAKGCEPRQVRDAGVEGSPSLIHLAGSPALPVEPPRSIGSFDDNWPWPLVPTFQAGLAATAGFKIQRCRADPDCEW